MCTLYAASAWVGIGVAYLVIGVCMVVARKAEGMALERRQNMVRC